MSGVYNLQARVTVHKKIGQRYYQLSLSAPDIARRAAPGQFVQVKIDCGDTPLLRRPLSIHDAGKGTIDLLYAVVGKGTKMLSAKKAGDPLDIIGPLGTGFDLTPAPDAYPVLVAGGMGIAPLYFLAKKLKSKAKIILIGAKDKKDLISVSGFKKLESRVCISTDDGSFGRKGYVTELLRQELGILKNRRLVIYACGPRPMLKEVARIARQAHIRAQVSLEEHMSCGFGACLGCVVKTTDGYKRVCKEGPVFDAREIVW